MITRNTVQVFGDGKQPLIFAHGFGVDQSLWKDVAPAFFKRFKVVTFNQVGAGNGDPLLYDRDKYGTYAAYAADLLELCASMDFQDAIYVGHSASAMIGALAAIREPARFKKLVMVAPSPCYLNDGDYSGGFSREAIGGLLTTMDNDFHAWGAAMAPMLMGNPERPELAARLNEAFGRTHPGIASHYARVIFLSDHRSIVSKVATETLVLQCRDDVVAPLAVGEFLARHLPNARLRVMKARGHYPSWSAPDETIAALRDFIDPS